MSKIHPFEINTGNPKSPNQILSAYDIDYMRENRVIPHRVAKKLIKAKTASEQSNILNKADEKIARDKADAEACERDCRGPMCIAKAMCIAAGVTCLFGAACGLGKRNKKTKKKGKKKKKKTKGGRKRKRRTRRRRSRRTKRRRTRNRK